MNRGSVKFTPQKDTCSGFIVERRGHRDLLQDVKLPAVTFDCWKDCHSFA